MACFSRAVAVPVCICHNFKEVGQAIQILHDLLQKREQTPALHLALLKNEVLLLGGHACMLLLSGQSCFEGSSMLMFELHGFSDTKAL